MIRRSREPTVRALSQRRFRRMKLHLLVLDFVRRFDAGASGIVVVKFPRGDAAVFPCSATDIDHSCRPEVSPGELLLASPNHLHWFSSAFRQACRFYRDLSGMFAAVAGTRVRN